MLILAAVKKEKKGKKRKLKNVHKPPSGTHEGINNLV